MEHDLSVAPLMGDKTSARIPYRWYATTPQAGTIPPELWQYMSYPQVELFLETLLTISRSVQSGRAQDAEHGLNTRYVDKAEFITTYGITATDQQIVEAILQGYPLKKFPQVMGLSSSAANKRIRQLWRKLHLESREQLLFVFGWMRLITPTLSCLQQEDP